MPSPDAADIARWLKSYPPDEVIAIGEVSGWWTAADVDAAVEQARTAPAPAPEPAHRPPITQARPLRVKPQPAWPRPPQPAPLAAPTARTRPPLQEPRDPMAPLVTAALVREARASIALDGETHVVDGPPASEPTEVMPALGLPLLPTDPHEEDQVDDVADTTPEVVHRAGPRDLLAEGLAHPDPAIAAAAEKARRAVDHLTTLLMRRPRPGAIR